MQSPQKCLNMLQEEKSFDKSLPNELTNVCV